MIEFSCWNCHKKDKELIRVDDRSYCKDCEEIVSDLEYGFFYYHFHEEVKECRWCYRKTLEDERYHCSQCSDIFCAGCILVCSNEDDDLPCYCLSCSKLTLPDFNRCVQQKTWYCNKCKKIKEV